MKILNAFEKVCCANPDSIEEAGKFSGADGGKVVLRQT